MKYDTIVVGAGAAGCPLAARLSEDPDRRVLLLEAGPVPGDLTEFPPELLDVGTAQAAMPGHPHNWSFLGHVTPDRSRSIARGRVLGGSSAIASGYFIRARSQDFDRWSQGGNDEWSWERALPVCRDLENDLDRAEDDHHGRSGPMPVSRAPQGHPANAAFLRAAAELGFVEEPDKNSQGEPGYGPVPLNAVDGMRINTGLAYIMLVRWRPNLTVQGDSYVRRVLFDGFRATGVEVMRDGAISVIEADEIVLSAGGIKSAHLLLVSGVGPRGQLDRFGIPVVSDRPGVGSRFSDHPQISVGWQPRHPIVDYSTSQAIGACLNFSSAEARAAQPSGALAGDLEILPMLKPTGFLLTDAALPVGETERNPFRRAIRAVRGMSTGRPAELIAARGDLRFIVTVQSETSRGTISLTSADPAVQPRIDYNCLSTRSDLERMAEAVRTAADLLRSPALTPLVHRLTELTTAILRNDDQLDAWMLRHLETAGDLSGSAPFGAVDDPASVVDQYGRVHGVTGLRVADTSILPTAPSRGSAATAVLIGEMIARFIRRGD